jgi:hypothetical protein
VEDEFLGPAMAALDDRRRAFVRALIGQTIPNQALAAEIAGFCPIESSVSRNRSGLLRKTGSVLAHEAGVLAAIQECAGKELKGGQLAAVRALLRLVADPSARGHHRAIESVLDRTGHSVQQQINVAHTHVDLTGKAMEEEILRLARKHGLDPVKLLGGNVIEGEVVEVKDDQGQETEKRL